MPSASTEPVPNQVPCWVCRAPDTKRFLVQRGVPVHQNLVMASRQAARELTRGDLCLHCCQECGFVFNAAFEGSKLRYGPQYDNTQTCSACFQEYIDQLVRTLIEEKDIRNQRIVEIGCGKGQFLRKLIDFPGSANRGLGFDPAYEGPELACQDRLQFHKLLFGPEAVEGQVDVVVCRHVIEHIAEPVRFLQPLRQALAGSPRVRLFFETPCVEWILANQVWWDFFFEHCSYFSAGSLTCAFRHAGFQVDAVRRVFGDQYLWLEARLGEPGVILEPGRVSELAAAFAVSWARRTAAWGQWLRQMAQAGTLVLWGAGAKGITVANLLDPEANLLAFLVDVNPNKQGRFVPGSGHPIVGPEALISQPPACVLVTNPNYLGEITQYLHSRGLNLPVVDLMKEEPA